MGKRKINPCSNIFGLVKSLITNLNSLADIFLDTRTVDHMEHVYNSVNGNCKILDSCNNWAIMQYLEAYYIKTKSPVIMLV